MKRILPLVLYVVFGYSYSQDSKSVNDFSGSFYNVEDTTIIYVFNEGKMLGILSSATRFKIISKGKYGFCHRFPPLEEVKTIELSEKSDQNNTNFCLIDENGGILSYEFESDCSKITKNCQLTLYGQKVFYFRKEDPISSTLIKCLYNEGLKDNRDYIKEYLDITAKEITATRSRIYSQPSVQSTAYLIKGDVVTVLEENKVWLKIKYHGAKLVHGWIRRKDTE